MNARGVKSTLTEKVQTALISIGTTAVVGCCTFLFKTNASLARIEQSLSNQIIIQNQEQAKVSTLQVKVASLEITTARMETRQNLKPR